MATHDPYAGRDGDRLAYLVHRLKYPEAPPLRLPGWPEDERLAAFAREVNAQLSPAALDGIIAQLEHAWALFRERGAAPRCRHCTVLLVPPRTHFCDAVCEAAFHAARFEV